MKTKKHTNDPMTDVIIAVVAETTAPLRVKISTLESEKENLAVFVKRLVRQSYKQGVRNKLTDDAMNYINNIGAECSPMRKLMKEVMS